MPRKELSYWGYLLPWLLWAVLWALVLYLASRGAVRAEPQDAVVRLTSHGASGTVIWTGEGKSYILSCAHAFEGQARNRRLTIDIPSPNPLPTLGNPRVTKVDYDLDLALIEMGYGPLPNVMPVSGMALASGRVGSLGYDEMKWPKVFTGATVLSQGRTTTYTRERPWHGRSGGALMDQGVLIGVVQGYEVEGQRRGMYVSHEAIVRFLGWKQAGCADERH